MKAKWDSLVFVSRSQHSSFEWVIAAGGGVSHGGGPEGGPNRCLIINQVRWKQKKAHTFSRLLNWYPIVPPEVFCEAKMHQVYFRLGLRPDPSGGAYTTLPDSVVGWTVEYPITPSPFPTPLDACGVLFSGRRLDLWRGDSDNGWVYHSLSSSCCLLNERLCRSAEVQYNFSTRMFSCIAAVNCMHLWDRINNALSCNAVRHCDSKLYVHRSVTLMYLGYIDWAT